MSVGQKELELRERDNDGSHQQVVTAGDIDLLTYTINQVIQMLS